MPFANQPIGGTTLVRSAIKSPNFVTGSTGWTVKKDGSAEFNNLNVRGTFSGTNYIINSAGEFFYSGTPALGNLIASIASTAGTDSFGNAYLAGITSYVGGTLVAEMINGELQIGLTSDDQPFILSASSGFATITSGRLSSGQTQAIIEMTASATNPQVFAGPATSSPVTTRAFEVGGSASLKGMLTTQVGGAEETIHSLSGFATGFAVGGEAHYRLVASPPNSVQISLRNITYNGTGTSTDGATILSSANGLPASYRPSTAKRLAATSNLLRQPSAGVFESCAVEVETDGSLQIFGLANGATRLDLHAVYPLDM